MPLTNFPDVLDELAEDIYQIADTHGFWDDNQIPGDGLLIPKLALAHDELSEALKVFREHYDDGAIDPIIGMTPMQSEDFTEEIADAIIRLLDLCGAYRLDIGTVLFAKMDKNRERPRMHGKRF